MPLSDTDRIVETIAARIRDGHLGPGDVLPSYSQLAEEFDVSTSTITRVMLVLRAQGLVVGQPGKNTKVADSPPSA